MLNSRVESAPTASATSSPTSIGHAIEELLRALAAHRPQGQTIKDVPETRLTAWKDEDYYYIDTKINKTEVSFCDINIMEGKVFIRIAREEEAEEPQEFLPRLATIVPIEIPIVA